MENELIDYFNKETVEKIAIYSTEILHYGTTPFYYHFSKHDNKIYFNVYLNEIHVFNNIFNSIQEFLNFIKSFKEEYVYNEKKVIIETVKEYREYQMIEIEKKQRIMDILTNIMSNH
jgi:hypothetical protein